MKVTIAIPVYNAAVYLKMAIQSVLNQTHKNFVLLIVNDGSTDNSAEIITNFNDDRIIFINDGKNLGLPARLNQIISLTKTQFLARMDADDIMHPQKIEKQLTIFSQNQQIDILGTNAYSIDENNLIDGIRMQEKNNLQKVSSFIHPTIMGKTSWFLENFYDEKAIRIEDNALWFATKNKSNFYVLTEPLFFYREFGTKYFLKYYKSLPSIFYLIKKHNFSFFWIKILIKQSVLTCVYFIFNIFNAERYLINKRNIVINQNQKTEAKIQIQKAINA